MEKEELIKQIGGFANELDDALSNLYDLQFELERVHSKFVELSNWFVEIKTNLEAKNGKK